MTRELGAAASVNPWTDRQERTVAAEDTERTGASGVAGDVLPDVEVLRSQVREKYRQVAVQPAERYHFHTGRPLAARLGYDPA
jgi:hypothetical protein